MCVRAAHEWPSLTLHLLFVRLVQPSVHQLHPAEAHLLLHAADILPHHADGGSVLGLLLARQAGCSCPGLSG